MKNRLNIKLFNSNQRIPAFPKFDTFSKYFSSLNHSPFPEPELEESYFCNVENKGEILSNISQRKGVGDIEKVIELSIKNGATEKAESRNLLIKEMLKIPNRTHPDVIKYGDLPHTVKLIGEKKSFSFKPDVFHNLAKSMNLLRNDTSNFTGHRSYFFCGQLAELESALIHYSVQKLVANGFQLMSVPDILPRSIIEGCGMETRGKRSQVYSLSPEHHGEDKCLSGTSEMALAGYLMNKKLSVNEKPLRIAAVSRCYRAETSRTSEERGIYRVHQFTKVEMFGVCEPDQSEKLLEEFRDFQEGHFASLGLHLRVLDMPAHELGAQAYRKYDLEAWLPAKEMWAEILTTSPPASSLLYQHPSWPSGWQGSITLNTLDNNNHLNVNPTKMIPTTSLPASSLLYQHPSWPSGRQGSITLNTLDNNNHLNVNPTKMIPTTSLPASSLLYQHPSWPSGRQGSITLNTLDNNNHLNVNPTKMVSSCSDCTDYQSRRLLIKSERDGTHLHTVNGTACAIPRLLIAIFETHQQPDGSIQIPQPLLRFMGGATSISKSHSKNIPKLKFIKRQL